MLLGLQLMYNHLAGNFAEAGNFVETGNVVEAGNVEEAVQVARNELDNLADLFVKEHRGWQTLCLMSSSKKIRFQQRFPSFAGVSALMHPFAQSSFS